jgi:hypothetical protein
MPTQTLAEDNESKCAHRSECAGLEVLIDALHPSVGFVVSTHNIQMSPVLTRMSSGV